MSTIHLNHLAGEKSPYLIQHANNPVDWYAWGPEALEKSKREQKPILLSIGYSTCHWCHVMAHESFENSDIAKIINESYVAIKVDREERPDIDQIYMSAVTALTGQGGWPLTAFLTPQGKPFYGGTYFPPYAKWGAPGFIDLLKTIAQAWSDQRDQLISSSEEITQLLINQSHRYESSMAADEALMYRAAEHLTQNFDLTNGGFNSAPKFPMGHTLSFLMRFYLRSGDENILKMVEKTLLAIAEGGINDHLGGGFHRYSTDAQWHVPHFEKMLYDQALLARAYLECYQITGNLKYATILQETLDYVLRDLEQPEGGFYCAEDADSLSQASDHKSEGAFYVWSAQEISSLLSDQEAKVFNYLYGVLPDGNVVNDPHNEFPKLNVLHLRHSIDEARAHLNIESSQILLIIHDAKSKLFNAREKRSRPHLDDKILTDWNALMIGVLAITGEILGKQVYLESAEKAAQFILSHLKIDNRLFHSWRAGKATNFGSLEDYAFLINAFLDLYEVTSNEQYLIEATQLSQQCLKLFEDKDHGGFFLTALDVPFLILRPKDIYDGALPSGNSAILYALARLFLMDSNPQWEHSTQQAFKLFSKSISQNPSAHTYALCALDLHIGPSIKIAFEGRASDSTLAQMKRVVYKHFIPSKVLLFKETNSEPIAVICKNNVCKPAIKAVDEFENHLLAR